MPDGTSEAGRLRLQTPGARAGRRDRATARAVYQAQALRRAFGRPAAHVFMIVRRLPAALVLRVLNSADRQLRR